MPFRRKPLGQADLKKRRAMLTPLGQFTLPGGPTPNGEPPLDDTQDFEPEPTEPAPDNGLPFDFDFPILPPRLPSWGFPPPRPPLPGDMEFPDIGTGNEIETNGTPPSFDEEPIGDSLEDEPINGPSLDDEGLPPPPEGEPPPLPTFPVPEVKPFPWKYFAIGVGALALFTLLKK